MLHTWCKHRTLWHSSLKRKSKKIQTQCPGVETAKITVKDWGVYGWGRDWDRSYEWRGKDYWQVEIRCFHLETFVLSVTFFVFTLLFLLCYFSYLFTCLFFFFFSFVIYLFIFFFVFGYASPECFHLGGYGEVPD